MLINQTGPWQRTKCEHTTIHSAEQWHPPGLPTRIRTAFNFWARCIGKCISTSYLLHGSDCTVLNLPALASPTWPVLPRIAENWLRSCRLWMSSSCYQLVLNKSQTSSHMFFLHQPCYRSFHSHLSASLLSIRNTITIISSVSSTMPQREPLPSQAHTLLHPENTCHVKPFLGKLKALLHQRVKALMCLGTWRAWCHAKYQMTIPNA